MSGPDGDQGRALSVRAVATGSALVAVFALVAPVNDWLLHNTFLYSQHLPVGVFLLLVVLGVAVNPLLGRRRFRANEMMVIIAMLLVLGGVVSSGLNAYFPAVVSGPAKILASSGDLAAFVDGAGEVQLPKGPYIGLPGHGVPDGNDPEHRYVIEGFHQGLGTQAPTVGHRATVTWRGPDGVERTQVAMASGADAGALDLDSGVGRMLAGRTAGAVVQGPDGAITVVAVAAPGIPWRAWLPALVAWAPLLASAMLCFVCIAALVRHQWMHNERLPYPIAEVITGFLQDPEPGRRLAPVFRSRAFWAAFAVAAAVLGANGLKALGLLSIALPTEISLWRSFNFPPFDQGYAPIWIALTPTIYFSIVGLVFFLPADLGFSLWFCFVLGNAVYALLRLQGVPVAPSMPAKVSIGGWFVECLLILWIGRGHYLALVRTAFSRTDDPQLREARPFTWGFIASAAGLVVSMVALGAFWHHAIIAALCYLGVGLVLARLVAEAGVPFVQAPIFCATLIFSLTGLTAPMSALVPLTMLGQSLSADPREHLLPFACNAEFLASRAGIPRLGWAAIAVVVLGVGTLLSGAVMLWCGYAHAGQQALDSWWRTGPLMGSLGPIADQARGGNPSAGSTYICYGLGAALTGGLGLARLAWAWWPIHPIGILVCACYPTYKIWFSFLLGWLAKVLVMRYGGVRLYKALKPAAMGLIAAEAVVAGIFLLIGLIAGLCGIPLAGHPQFLPG